jgi:hypothetical protein
MIPVFLVHISHIYLDIILPFRYLSSCVSAAPPPEHHLDLRLASDPALSRVLLQTSPVCYLYHVRALIPLCNRWYPFVRVE